MPASRPCALITGAAGFLGSHLCDRFLGEGWEVIGIDSLLTGSSENVAHLTGHPRFRFVRHDVTAAFAVDRTVDVVLHFACPASPKDYLRYPVQTLVAGALGTMHTLDLARAQRARYLLASTSEVYGDPQVHPQAESYWGYVNPVGPRSVYDEAKRYAEALVMAHYRAQGLDVRIARIFNTYGPRMRADDGRVIPTFITRALRGDPIPVRGDGRQTRSFCYVDDLVDGIYRLATQDDLAGEVFNLGNPEEHTILHIAQMVQVIAESEVPVVHVSALEDDPQRRCPNIGKARARLGWSPRVALREGLQRTTDWFVLRIVQGRAGRGAALTKT